MFVALLAWGNTYEYRDNDVCMILCRVRVHILRERGRLQIRDGGGLLLPGQDRIRAPQPRLSRYTACKIVDNCSAPQINTLPVLVCPRRMATESAPLRVHLCGSLK